MDSRSLSRVIAAGSALALAGVLAVSSRAEQQTPAPVRMSLDQARQTVNMLNDLYVTTVVDVHSTYVKDRGTPAAAVVARQVFEGMKAKGWPETRWLSTTGRPFNPKHNPKDQFERDAIVHLKKGEARFERVEDGKLRVATLIPLVDKSCAMCHTKDKVGDPIGGLSYTVYLKQQ
ncbi:MAG TPA: DUF3365 domain-containing protein [Armatimonadota bacterium]|nr:DUF3365 domain-containing protein [Armatimonadota bacterium]